MASKNLLISKPSGWRNPSWKFFEEKIAEFFQKNGRKDLPWRPKRITPYQVWVSEIMLQQTQVDRVIPFYKRFLKRFPDIQALSKTSWEEFLPYYQGLGYYRRGRNMLQTAKIVVQEYQGAFPKDIHLLQKFPGIGEYTAKAILSFGYCKKMIALDTNIQKVLGRFFLGSKDARVDVNSLEKNVSISGKILNAAMMDLSASTCKNIPLCKKCPLRTRCCYFHQKGVLETKKNKQSTRTMFPMKDAQVFLWLHREHQEYYSSTDRSFHVFILPAALNTRQKIQEYFQKTYQLQLAVRPPHRKAWIKGIPTLFINAQILSGIPRFAVFPKKVVQKVQSLLK